MLPKYLSILMPWRRSVGEVGMRKNVFCPHASARNRNFTFHRSDFGPQKRDGLHGNNPTVCPGRQATLAYSQPTSIPQSSGLVLL